MSALFGLFKKVTGTAASNSAAKQRQVLYTVQVTLSNTKQLEEVMKNFFKFLGIIVLALVVGFAVSCGDDDNGGGCSHTAGAAATCTTAQTCTKCGNVIQAAFGHQGLIAAFAPTCTTAGNSDESGTCTRSGCLVTGTVIPALGHDHVSSLICKRSGCEHQYALGDTGPAGGIIFYIDTNGFKLYQGTNNNVALDAYTTAYYLEVWTETVSGIRWSWSSEAKPPPFAHTDVPLVQQAHDTENTAQWIGYGLRNTRLIINAMNVPDNQDGIRANRAVHIASDSKGGFNDWFLPSVDELNAIYIARAAPNNINIPGFAVTGWHWSSSQRNTSDAWRRFITNGSSTGEVFSDKQLNLHVRAVRAF